MDQCVQPVITALQEVLPQHRDQKANTEIEACLELPAQIV